MDPEDRPIQKLVLVFNADAGALNALIDSTKKLFQINDCALCSITHGLFGETTDWKSCREEIGVPVEYLHRDELGEQSRAVTRDELPCVLAETEKGLELLMGPDALNRCSGNVQDFRGRLIHHAIGLGLTLD